MYLRKASAVILAAAASALLLVVLVAACGGDSEEIDVGEIEVSGVFFHDPAGSLATVAVRFDSVPGPDVDLTIEVLNVETDEVVSILTVDESVTSDACSGRSYPRSEGWVVFSIRGPDAGEFEQLLIARTRSRPPPDMHELILTLNTEQSPLIIPDEICFATE